MVEQIRKLVHSNFFSRCILVLIVLSGVLVGCETYPAFADDQPLGKVVNLVQDVILGLFVLEAILKIISFSPRPWDYFKRPWNIFDFSIILICFLPIDARYATVFRLARLLRTLRMVTVLPRLQILVGALLKSIPSLGYIGVLLGLHFYVYAVAGTFLFGKNDPIRFGNLHETTLTLFQVLTLEGWNDILATQYHGSDTEYSEEWLDLVKARNLPYESKATPIVASAYFVSFILLGTMIMLNLFTGVIISSMEEATSETKEEAREEQLKQRGFLTLHDELQLLGHQLKELSERIKGIEIRDERESKDKAP